MTKTICQFCGWEVSKPDWYNSYNGKLICDNCLMDSATEREKEKAI
jgi:formylmethanofuran dehydrogenase subunit E